MRVETNDPGKPVINLRLGFVSQGLIDVLPSRFVSLNGFAGDAMTRTLVLRRNDGEELKILGASARNPGVAIETTPVTAENAEQATKAARGAQVGDVLLAVSATEAIQTGASAGQIVIETNHPDKPQLLLPLRANVRALVDVQPRRVTLNHRPGGATQASAQVTLRHGRGRPFRVASVELEGELPGVSVSVPTEGQARQHRVELRVEGEELAPGRYSGTLVATTALKKIPPLRVPVTLRVMEPAPSAQPPKESAATSQGDATAR